MNKFIILLIVTIVVLAQIQQQYNFKMLGAGNLFPLSSAEYFLEFFFFFWLIISQMSADWEKKIVIQFLKVQDDVKGLFLSGQQSKTQMT